MQLRSVDTLEVDLQHEDIDVLEMLAVRAALRTLPVLFFGAVSGDAYSNAALPACRACLTSSVHIFFPTEELGFAARNAAASKYLRADTSFKTDPFNQACLVSKSHHDGDKRTVAFASRAIGAAMFINGEDAESSHFLRLAEEEARLTKHECFARPLWTDDTWPSLLKSEWTSFSQFACEKIEWRFWKVWYASLLSGQSVDWSLLKKIALFENELWQTGAKGVGLEIEVTE